MQGAYLSAPVGSELSALLASDRERYERRIARAKAKEYPRRTPEGWTKAGYANSGLIEQLSRTVPDLLPSVNANALSEADFADLYERGSQPVIVRGLCNSWPAVREARWSAESLLHEYGEDRFKVGEDDDGYPVYVKLKYFIQYMMETKDDSPLYIFDSSFAERESTRSMRHDWTLPKFFTDDLFKLVGERRRPPYRWLVLGPGVDRWLPR
uniref:Cupin-like domain-containing protein n=1 Tax=Haptolina brevifila TaxID=156173 RepID=A0A7S2FTJ7_9EUKA|mmetsp:Transcript_18905/g.38506  ORF Transcript_18905/g.38506 Transcript_18905/m.38506 type:complete len:211 (+) Transcript_18905:29-661(+)